MKRKKNNPYGGHKAKGRGIALFGQEPRTPQVVETTYCDVATRVVVTVLKGPADHASPKARPYVGGTTNGGAYE